MRQGFDPVEPRFILLSPLWRRFSTDFKASSALLPGESRRPNSNYADMTPRHQLDLVLARLRGFDNPDSPDGLMGAILEFQRLVWGSSEWSDGLAPDAVDVIRDLAYDLDFYEPDSSARLEDRSFFGEERAIELIRAALAAIR